MSDDSNPVGLDGDHPVAPAVERERVADLKRVHERKHFVFATVLIMGCVLGLPVMGALYVLFIRWGWLASPMAQ